MEEAAGQPSSSTSNGTQGCFSSKRAVNNMSKHNVMPGRLL